MRSHAKIKLEPIGKRLTVRKGTPLKDFLYEYGVEFPCAGKGTCGRCKVKILKGEIRKSEKEKKLIQKLKLLPRYRLSCRTHVQSDITLEITQFESIFLADDTEYDFIPGTGYGIAIDLGTTTIIAQLIDLARGNVLNVKTSLNPQMGYGSDVISRIESGLTKGGMETLQQLIRKKISQLIQAFHKDNQVEISKVVIVGNSVMYHIFCGFDLAPLAYYPFVTSKREFINFSAKDLGLEFPIKSKISFLPPIGSFVGSDILAGIVASKMHLNEEFTGLIDLGTNGEIVFGNKNRILCASTSAGPAFEGLNISMGMRSIGGAISSVELHNGNFIANVIGNENPRGICGSGLIDAIAAFQESGLMDPSGRFLDDQEKIFITHKVGVTQKDIREFQLAKAAIAAGTKILLDRLGIDYKDVCKVYLSGGFGNFLNNKNVRSIGLLDFPLEKMHKLGNSALIGAKMFLFLDEKFSYDIMEKTEHISLESSSNFQEIFVKELLFIDHSDAIQ